MQDLATIRRQICEAPSFCSTVRYVEVLWMTVVSSNEYHWALIW